MRCYNGCIPESDYRRRHGYTQREYETLKSEHPEILVTWFPMEGRFCACLPKDAYRDLTGWHTDKMECLREAIEKQQQEQEMEMEIEMEQEMEMGQPAHR